MIGTRSWRVACVLVALGLAALAGGCGGPKSIAADSPQATAQGFVEAIKAGDYELAATGFDYVTYARAGNEDWDTFGESQRNLIVDKLREDKAAELQALSGMLAEGAQVGAGQTQGTQAIVPVTAGASTMQLYLTQQDGLWYIRGIQEGPSG